MSEALFEAIAGGRVLPFYILSGDRLVAEPVAEKVAAAVAESIGCEVEVRRRPAELTPTLADLRTLSLFGNGKVILVVDSGVLADAKDVADLVDDAGDVLPVGSNDLSSDERRGAGRLLQALRLFELDPYGAAAQEVLAQLPAWAFQGGSTFRKRSKNRPRGKRQAQDLRDGLTQLLEAARENDLEGWAETELAELSNLVAGGLPTGHCLILVERSVAGDHPLVATVRESGGFVEFDRVSAGRRGGWEGLGDLSAQLEQETGVKIRPGALEELARRTLQKEDRRKGGGVDVDSTERLAGEYRKLASLASESGAIDKALVEQAVDDRGDEDVFKILDAIGSGNAADAIHRLDRLLAAADDKIAARLGFFSLLAGFAGHLTAVAGMARVAGVARGVTNYNRFKNDLAPRLTGERPGSGKNPLAGMHPFRLHRIYLAASRLPAELLAVLPARTLEAEIALKGGSRRPDAVLAAFLGLLSGRAPA